MVDPTQVEAEKLLVRPRCPKCGFKIRGKQHEKGNHHKHGEERQYTPPKRGM